MNTDRLLEVWRDLGSAGIVVSIIYGPSGGAATRCWSVALLFPDGSGADKDPFAAESFGHAVWIAWQMAFKLGWVGMIPAWSPEEEARWKEMAT